MTNLDNCRIQLPTATHLYPHSTIHETSRKRKFVDSFPQNRKVCFAGLQKVGPSSVRTSSFGMFTHKVGQLRTSLLKVSRVNPRQLIKPTVAGTRRQVSKK